MKKRGTLEQAIVAAVEREHKRFASDLHDGVCQELAGVAMMLDATLPRVASDVATEIRSIAAHIRRVTLDARRLALGLAPIALERSGLSGALAQLKQDVEALGGPTVVVSLEERFSHGLPLDMAVNLHRITQEATANAVRHYFSWQTMSCIDHKTLKFTANTLIRLDIVLAPCHPGRRGKGVAHVI
jgi:signal transduction histidine kinase